VLIVGCCLCCLSTGKCTYTDGSVYEGEFANTMQHGQGTLTSARGEVLKGEFNNGRPWNAEGTWRPQTGPILKGRWVEGCFQGEQMHRANEDFRKPIKGVQRAWQRPWERKLER
jgi:hypothetical protein